MFLGQGFAHKSFPEVIIGIDGDLGDHRSFFNCWAQALAAVKELLVLGDVDVGALGHLMMKEIIVVGGDGMM